MAKYDLTAFDYYYDFIDRKMVEGDEEARKLIEKYGYAIEDSLLYEFVYEKMVEGEDEARKLIEKYGYLS